jgi:hypothetical protein
MAASQLVLSREEAQDFVHWVLSEVATRPPSKHQKAPLVAKHISRQILPKYLRGSDLSERVYASAETLRRAGYAQKEALPIVAQSAQKYLGKSRRGRPSAKTTKRDFMSTVQSVRSMMNAFAKRKQYTERAVDWWVGRFVWGRREGAIRGSEYDPDFGRRTHQALLQWKQQLRRLGVRW